MIYILISYLITTAIFFIIRQKLKTKHIEINNLKIDSNGVHFFSHARHRINIGNSKIMQVGNVVYVKKEEKLITIKNVSDIYLKNDYLYFTSNGKCEICFPCGRLSKYFNIRISSHMFNVADIRQKALNSIPNNLFSINKSVELKEYLKIIKKVLNINITKKFIKVSQNQFKIPFKLEYVANNTKKVVYINQKLD